MFLKFSLLYNLATLLQKKSISAFNNALASNPQLLISQQNSVPMHTFKELFILLRMVFSLLLILVRTVSSRVNDKNIIGSILGFFSSKGYFKVFSTLMSIPFSLTPSCAVSSSVPAISWSREDMSIFSEFLYEIYSNFLPCRTLLQVPKTVKVNP